MKKRIWSILLTLCMVLAMIPGTVFAVTDDSAEINGVHYATLQSAVNVVADGQTIKLLNNVTESISIPYGNTISFTLDLNGRTMEASTNSHTINHGGSGALTITDTSPSSNGKILNQKDFQYHVIYIANTGTVNLVNGIVEKNTVSDNGSAVRIASAGHLNISGGKVISTVIAVASDYGGSGTADITVSGGEITSSGSNSCVYLKDNYNFTLRGGIISHTNDSGFAINRTDSFFSAFKIELFPGELATIRSTKQAMNLSPTNIIGNPVSTASVNTDGTDLASYNSANIASYKYLQFIAPATAPSEPTIGTVTAGNGNATISFTAPDSNGGAEITSYTVTSSPGGITGTGISSPITLTGLTNGTAYTFTVTATNSAGTSIASAESNSVTPKVPATVPSAPIIGTATAGNGHATISFTPPASDGGAEVTNYTVTSSPGGISGSGVSSPIKLSGLTNGTAYTFTVTATNSVGTSIASAESNSVTPTLPPTSGSSGGSSTPTLITKISTGGTVTGTNVDRLVKEGKNLTVEGKTGEKLVFDTGALKNIGDQTNDSLKVEIKDVSKDHTSKLLGKLVVSLTVTAGGKKISNFGTGTATIALPYELKEGEKAEDVTVWYLSEDGTMSEVPCSYDPKTKLATFKVHHFSLYVVGTDALAKWVNPFGDIKESHWFYEAVRFVSVNKLMQGTKETAFDPKGKTTRGMIVTTLWRMENQPKAVKEITFTDVKSGEYYHDAVAWAAEKGIVSGYTAEKFGPEDSITREQLAVILHNYAASKGYKTSTAGDLSAFSDAGAIHKWGKEAIAWANGERLINGTGNNLLDPAGTAERSQVAAILQRFVENIKI